MDNLRRLGNQVSVSIKPDEDGFTGRECAAASCEGYFKIQSGTGLKGDGLPCHCPYCGHTALQDQFWTKEQLAYANSIALRQFTETLQKNLKSHEIHQEPRGAFGIGMSLEFKPGQLPAIHHYREKQLETEVVCATCTLRYSVYGVFAYCPDCGQHNSLQILEKNLDVVCKMLDLATSAEGDVASKLIENALEDCVSAFDGYREREKGGGPAEGVYYVPPIFREVSVETLLNSKYSNAIRAVELRSSFDGGCDLITSTQSAINLSVIPSNSIDYIFTDPPYSWKVQYGESNFLWESWLKLDNKWHSEEVIVNEFRGKTMADWANLMRPAMAECFRVLKPGRTVSMCYHDTSEGTWTLVQDLVAPTHRSRSTTPT